MPRFPHVLLLSWCLVVAPGSKVGAQQPSGNPVTAPTPAPSAAETAPTPSVPALKPVPPPKTEEEIRIEMLEKLADQLSHRMRSMKAREAALAAAEDALEEREEAVRKREEMIGSMEELMRLREEVLKRREKLPPPQTWNGPPPPAIHGQYAAVLDGETMQFYHKKQAETKVPVASTQKIVTALVICQDGNLDGFAEIPEEVLEVEPTVVGVKPGERYTRRQLLTALLVKSGNDIAATLAIDNAGSIEAFARKMNTYAKFIGMADSNFVNPHGLPAEGQYSTARDIAIAAFEAYQNPDIREMVSKKSYDFVFNDGRVYTLPNTNRVLSDMEGCNGMKTGFTYAAGNCLVCSANVDGKDRISVVLKSARPQVQEDSKALLNWSLGLPFTGPMKPCGRR
jgi:D-alanyl-D-alanine carboxypeptidase (penicillin-binding protein 5/6)